MSVTLRRSRTRTRPYDVKADNLTLVLDALNVELEKVDAAIAEKQDASPVLSGTTASFTTELAELLNSLSSAANAFGKITVSGQTDVTADAPGDTLTIAAGANITITTDGSGTVTITAAATIPDGDKGDIIVSDSGATWSIDPAALPGAPVYVQEADPGGTGPLVWFETDSSGNVLDMVVRTP